MVQKLQSTTETRRHRENQMMNTIDNRVFNMPEQKKYLHYSVSPCLRGIFIVFAVAALLGCSTMTPVYSRPDSPVPATFKDASGKVSDRKLAEIPWQEFFVDSQLRKLIILTLENNRDLRIAALNIERSMALHQIQRSNLFPKIDASAAATIQRIPEDFSSSGRSITTDQYTVGLGLSSYELDLFGRVRSLRDQALQQYLATEQARVSVQISLVSQVAAAYLTLAADRERLRLSKETLTNQKASYQLTKNRFEAGISGALALHQAQTTVDAARVDVSRYTTLVSQDENALNLLVGSAIPPELAPQSLSDMPSPLKDVAVGLPSDVLLMRPDIKQAENLLKGFNANIGAARAAFFPRISLVSSVGFGSSELSGLFGGGSFAWSFAPKITLPLFDAGSNKANLKVAEVDRDIAVAQYDKTIQSAFREVSDALAQRANINEQLAAQQSLADATTESHRISKTRFDNGIDSYLALLDSQRAMYAAQQGLIGVRLSAFNSIVTLYKALGGGGI